MEALSLASTWELVARLTDWFLQPQDHPKPKTKPTMVESLKIWIGAQDIILRQNKNLKTIVTEMSLIRIPRS